MFTAVCHLPLSWTIWIHSILSHPVFFRSVLVLFSHQCLCFSSSLFLSAFPTKYPVCMSHLSHMCYMPRPCHHPWLNHPDSIRCAVHIVKLFTMQFSQPYYFFLFLRPKYLPQHHIPENTQPTLLLWCYIPSFTPIYNNKQYYSSAYISLHCFG